MIPATGWSPDTVTPIQVTSAPLPIDLVGKYLDATASLLSLLSIASDVIGTASVVGLIGDNGELTLEIVLHDCYGAVLIDNIDFEQLQIITYDGYRPGVFVQGLQPRRINKSPHHKLQTLGVFKHDLLGAFVDTASDAQSGYGWFIDGTDLVLDDLMPSKQFIVVGISADAYLVIDDDIFSSE